jgi:hypothetical protein
MSDGIKFDAGKLRYSLLPPGTIKEAVKVLEFGAQKYAPDNWKRVPDAQTRYYDAAMRHIEAWRDGEVHDPETSLSHLAHAMCCLMFLQWFDAQEPEDFSNAQTEQKPWSTAELLSGINDLEWISRNPKAHGPISDMDAIKAGLVRKAALPLPNLDLSGGYPNQDIGQVLYACSHDTGSET